MNVSDLQFSFVQQIGSFEVHIMIGISGVVITVCKKEVDEFES